MLKVPLRERQDRPGQAGVGSRRAWRQAGSERRERGIAWRGALKAKACQPESLAAGIIRPSGAQEVLFSCPVTSSHYAPAFSSPRLSGPSVYLSVISPCVTLWAMTEVTWKLE